MSDRYTTPNKGTLDWHIPLSDNFDRLDRDVEFRGAEAELGNHNPTNGGKYFATDSGAIYTGDGQSWNLVGYATRAVGGDLGHYVEYADGLADEPVNSFLFDSEESLEITRISFPIKGAASDLTVSDAVLRVYEGDSMLVETAGNTLKRAGTADSAPWVATTSAVTVTVTNATGAPIAAIPKVWANVRRT